MLKKVPKELDKIMGNLQLMHGQILSTRMVDGQQESIIISEKENSPTWSINTFGQLELFSKLIEDALVCFQPWHQKGIAYDLNFVGQRIILVLQCFGRKC